jgi:hypothetical protein
MAKLPTPPPPPEITEVTQIIAAIIDQRRDEASISPTWVATETLAKMGKVWLLRSTHRYDPETYVLAHHHCRQIARSLLRQYFEPEAGPPEPHPLFPDLQWRYPAAPAPERDEPVYVKLELLTVDDWRFNLHRLEAEATAKLRHRDALFAWGRRRFKKLA